MKVRTDFVTNSSSSSFVLVFKDEDEYKEFEDECYDSGYEEFFALANRNKTSRKQCKTVEDMLLRYYIFEKCDGHEIKKTIANQKGIDTWNVDEDCEEFQTEIKKRLAETDYEDVLKRLREAEVVVAGEINDYDGGLLEWAIRDRFISSEFRKYTILDWQIG